MRRGIGALVGIVLVCLLPGIASAATIDVGSLDQSVDRSPAWVVVDGSAPEHATQSFTAGKSGHLTYVSVYCASSDDNPLWVFVGDTGGRGSCRTTPGWVDFPIYEPPAVVAGQQYKFWVSPMPTAVDRFAVAKSAYGGGCFRMGSGCSTETPDLAFRTYVQPEPTLSMHWSASQIPAGTSSQVTLMVTAQFPAWVPNPSLPGHPTDEVKFEPSPSWVGTGWIGGDTAATCSEPGEPSWGCGSWPGPFELPTTGKPMTVTISIPVNPVPPVGQSTLSLSATACVPYVFSGEHVPFIDCGRGTTQLAVGAPNPTAAPPAVSPPPTTAWSHAPGSSAPSGLPLDAAALAGVLAFVAVAGRRGRFAEGRAR